MIYIIAYKDELGFDCEGLPWLTGLTEDEAEAFNTASKCREAGYKDVTVFSSDKDTIERMENIGWSFVNENKVEDTVVI